MHEVIQTTLIANKEDFHLPEHLSGLLLGLFAHVSLAFLLEGFREALAFCSFGTCHNLFRRSFVGLTMSDFALVRKKKAIAKKIEGLRGRSRERGRCWGGLHLLPKSSVYALLEALDHLDMRPPTISSEYGKTVECLFLPVL